MDIVTEEPLDAPQSGQEDVRAEAGVVGNVLCVDLDGTLIASDLLYESLLSLIRRKPWEVVLIPYWLLSGRAFLKSKLREHGTLAPDELPYRDEVIAFLRDRRDEGRMLVLATAADHSLARSVAEHLGLFHEVIASDGKANLKGRAKLQAIESQFGRGGFDYIGDAWVDLPIWEAADKAIAVSPRGKLRRTLLTVQPDAEIIEVERSGGLKRWLRLFRVHQWAKNVLLFVPLITAHRILDPNAVNGAIRAFFAFSLGASAHYIANDLLDLPSDRRHPRKRFRPIAAGAISIPVAMLASVVSLGGALALTVTLPPMFLAIFLIYLFTSIVYSLSLKRKLMVDVLCLAGLYTIRILAGGAATGIEISTWLMAFSMFLFLSLAFVKRYTELLENETERDHRLPGRGYYTTDLEMIRSVGPASGYLAVLVVGLYVNDQLAVAQYHRPKLLWLLCPILLHWISRIWFLAQRGQMHHDPVVFALGDRISIITGIACILVVGAAIFF